MVEVLALRLGASRLSAMSLSAGVAFLVLVLGYLRLMFGLTLLRLMFGLTLLLLMFGLTLLLLVFGRDYRRALLVGQWQR